ncbi:putative secreted pili protein [Richelia sinica FACHB-800]|uniref:Secreted pili protein n=1 Tax=Richelia sinica FACHB-800 TaxID=1357546 RepID=A0A975TD34_9NOST|nr:spore coat U domain-containing protein [Richelia sinica]MBD2665451.1 spore coat protein U domain-containing protein [Richelia sinica FACHB-800]QXE25691.1 putative secreted pili protein [Richelia sinica FACHB-800]
MNGQKLLLISGTIITSNLLISPALCQCSVSSTSVIFGNYDVFSNTPTTSTGSITYDCSAASPTPTLITIDLSPGNSAAYNARELRSINDVINYNLYLDAGGQFIWGNGTNSQHYTSSNLSATVTIYGIIPARQNVKVGNYTDSITATINF